MSDFEVEFGGLVKSRFQQCAFCNRPYDAALDTCKPHGVCEACWPEVSRIEMEHTEKYPMHRPLFLEVVK